MQKGLQQGRALYPTLALCGVMMRLSGGVSVSRFFPASFQFCIFQYKTFAVGGHTCTRLGSVRRFFARPLVSFCVAPLFLLHSKRPRVHARARGGRFALSGQYRHVGCARLRRRCVVLAVERLAARCVVVDRARVRCLLLPAPFQQMP